MAENKDKSNENSLKNLEKGKWEKGKSGNPNGRPKGQRNYATIYREALEKIAELNNLTPEELEDDIIAKAIKAARNGDYRFYKDINDRLHGSAQQHIDHTTKGEAIGSERKEEINKALNNII